MYLDLLLSSSFIMHGKCFLMGLLLWKQGEPHLTFLNPKGHSNLIKLSECPLAELYLSLPIEPVLREPLPLQDFLASFRCKSDLGEKI